MKQTQIGGPAWEMPQGIHTRTFNFSTAVYSSDVGRDIETVLQLWCPTKLTILYKNHVLLFKYQ